jgi:hypothetical protein
MESFIDLPGTTPRPGALKCVWIPGPDGRLECIWVPDWERDEREAAAAERPAGSAAA